MIFNSTCYVSGAAVLWLLAGVAAADDVKPFATKAVSEAQLNSIVGKADVNQAVVARNTANVSHNNVGDNATTGTISFDGQAFQDLRGLSVLSANTGNNVSINASMNVNVAIRQ